MLLITYMERVVVKRRSGKGVVFAPIFPFNILLLVLFFVNPIPTDFISFVFLYVASPRKRYKAVSNNALIRLPLHMD